MKIVLVVISIALLATSGYLLNEVRQLSNAIENTQTKLLEARVELQKREQELARIADENTRRIEADKKDKAAKDLITPKQFGYYAYLAQEHALKRLQQLEEHIELVQGPIDVATAKPPEIIFKQGPLHLVLYDRVFSIAVRPTVFIHIVAKVKDEPSWVVRNRGFEVQVAPRSDNRDILDVITVLAPGRYAIQMANRFYAFSVEGTVNNPNYCVERERATYYKVCAGGTP